MTNHLHRDMQNLHKQILGLSAVVEEMIDQAALALTQRRVDLVPQVREADNTVDKREVWIEEECLKMLALHQPVAVDLRRIATVLKANNDLERIGDLAVNIAERANSLDSYPDFPIPERLEQMVTRSTAMVRDALDSFVHLDADKARQVMARDDEVDRMNVEVIDEIRNLMQSNPDHVNPAMHCFSASRHIERIADHATNIAEDVIYLVEGEIIRHRHLDYLTQ